MRHILHKFIVWYLRRSAGAFHCYAYGPDGRYVKLMTDKEYGSYHKLEAAFRDILIAHGSYGDGGNLDKFTRDKCNAVLDDGKSDALK